MKENIQIYDQTRKPRSNQWLNEYARNVTSQNGEDGIIEKIIEVINNSNKWCVEFGCWDGKYLSNTFNLIENFGYSAVLIEGDTKKYEDLLKTYEGNKKVIPINTYVGFDQENCLDVLLETTEIPVDFDVLSIDVDGNDYHMWEAVNRYKPKVVVIEFNPTIPKTVEFVQPRDKFVTQGNSLLSIAKLGKSKGYELVSTTIGNAIFVDSNYYSLFDIDDNSVDMMMSDESLVTHIFSGYDGTVFIRGHCKLPWLDIAFNENKVQQLPKFLRKPLIGRSKFRKKIIKRYRYLREKGII